MDSFSSKYNSNSQYLALFHLVFHILFILSSDRCGVVESHVSLTFPPARDYPLDFLDVLRTQRNCGGLKKDPSKATSLEAGRQYTFSWHLGYPHNGGYTLELLDARDQKLKFLTPPDGSYQGGVNKEVQSHTITLDSDTICKGCAIRLVRQALEWGPRYLFQSCADVDIVSPVDFKDQCSGHGQYSGSYCNCERNYFGDLCQFKNDCTDDNDCNLNGFCDDIGGTSLPRKQCFCKAGFFGLNCDLVSNVTRRDSFLSNVFKYEVYRSQRGINFYYRPVDNGRQVEGVIEGERTTSYVAVGWRSFDQTVECKRFPPVLASPTGNFHPMDCMDIVIGTVRSGGHRINDYYTRDRSTPLLDNRYGGSDDLTSALGWEEDGRTYVMFRKPTGRSHPTDNAFEGRLKLIWSFGQYGSDDFYAEDELKYHGNNRGFGEIVAIGFNSAPSSKILTTWPSILCTSFFALTLNLLYVQSSPIHFLL